ncbi:HTH-type transcriptional activator CmpR [Defluviimonas aquaemixtae]|uniref:HTH-type transcriptional activator CmpR n=1 Tax=Albidovulum aquaemixtae TaxID=1542388 RepID=A0A2R8B5U0_9RHOB|nr:LysR family transcriptional regulator [Defluviimonas aquaemixtae]SPH18011.1 HTH-type transcriptional activator CmpR [Defluviimonas aquaemixtae]
MLGKGITLRALELFETIAQTGTVAEAARRMKMSLPAASQQLSNLETAIGCTLFDRAHRPLKLTAAGRVFLFRAREALSQIRQAQTELTVLDISHLKSLRLGMIDDFDSQITPDLVVALAKNLKNCEFRLTTAPSHEAIEMLVSRALDVAVAARPQDAVPGMREYGLLRDPYVLAVPKGFALPRRRELDALAKLPFLRYDRGTLMGRQIEAHLARHDLTPLDRFEIDSNQSIMALVANGTGFSITTPLALLRARIFLDQVDLHPLPLAAMSRTISLFAPTDQAGDSAAEIARTLRTIMTTRLVGPAKDLAPWLGDAFVVFPS